jgi:hypothetical protein
LALACSINLSPIVQKRKAQAKYIEAHLEKERQAVDPALAGAADLALLGYSLFFQELVVLLHEAGWRFLTAG